MNLTIVKLIHKSPRILKMHSTGEPYIQVQSLLNEIERQTREGNMFSAVNMCNGFNAALFLFDLKIRLQEELLTQDEVKP